MVQIWYKELSERERQDLSDQMMATMTVASPWFLSHGVTHPIPAGVQLLGWAKEGRVS